MKRSSVGGGFVGGGGGKVTVLDVALLPNWGRGRELTPGYLEKKNSSKEGKRTGGERRVCLSVL